ncbi:hypothetical protein Emin_0295 [Elusimicrobium minutum Pei191]|uniref:Uncharacterized protein n=1 Tax=Elusimicrobium minutum (strain Pei191) TaxID=445932 RepID=B2KBV1_ELUMP|nr:hypothetical protein [Elusimicrobium minutum]ACC97855.1 hypothetical protein Emin_0295 [Elusimicrobium minutum Pei191]
MRVRINRKKIVVLLTIFATVGFLLLPIIDGTLNKNAILNSLNNKRAVPQVASANPLTRAMQFISSLLGMNRGRTPVLAKAELSKGSPNSDKLTSAQRAALGLIPGGEEVSVPSSSDMSFDGNSSIFDLGSEVKDKNGNWVSIDKHSAKRASASDINKQKNQSASRSNKNSYTSKHQYANDSSGGPLTKSFTEGAARGISTGAGAAGSKYSLAKASIGTGAGGTFSASTSGAVNNFSRGDVSLGGGADGLSLPNINKAFSSATQKVAEANAYKDENGKQLSAKEKTSVREQYLREKYNEHMNEAWDMVEEAAKNRLFSGRIGQEADFYEDEIVSSDCKDGKCEYKSSSKLIAEREKNAAINILNAVGVNGNDALISSYTEGKALSEYRPDIVYVYMSLDDISNKSDSEVVSAVWAGNTPEIEETQKQKNERKKLAEDLRKDSSLCNKGCFVISKNTPYFEDVAKCAGGKVYDVKSKISNSSKDYIVIDGKRAAEELKNKRNITVVTTSKATSIKVYDVLGVPAANIISADRNDFLGSKNVSGMQQFSNKINRSIVNKYSMLNKSFNEKQKNYFERELADRTESASASAGNGVNITKTSSYLKR